MNTNIERLSQMLKRHFYFWTEAFKDEETGEDVSIERRDILDPDLSDEERQLIKAIAADIPNLTDDELHQFREEIVPFDSETIDLIYIERVRRGEESLAESIEDVPTLRELCDKGNRWAAYALFQKYYLGDEKQGIFINRQKAREYYDMVPAPTSMSSKAIPQISMLWKLSSATSASALAYLRTKRTD